MKEVLKIENGIIAGHSIVDRESRENEIEVNNWNGTVGEPLVFYNEKYERIEDLKLYERGLKKVPEGKKLEGDQLVDMTEVEKIEAGLEELDPHYKIEKGKLVEKSQIEKIKEGLEEIPEGFKIVKGELVEMTEIERIEAGLEELDPHYKIVKGELVEKSLDEQLKDQVITQTEYNQIKIWEQEEYLRSTDWVVIKMCEYQMSEKKLTHDYSDVLAERAKARERINALEGDTK